MDPLWNLWNGFLIYWALGSFLVYWDWEMVHNLIEDTVEHLSGDPHLCGYLWVSPNGETVIRWVMLLIASLGGPVVYANIYTRRFWSWLRGETPLQQAHKVIKLIRESLDDPTLPADLRGRMEILEVKVEEIEVDLQRRLTVQVEPLTDHSQKIKSEDTPPD